MFNRFLNLFGKWRGSSYNSAVATFCNNTANDLPITVNDRTTELELFFIDDLIAEMFEALSGHEYHYEFDGLNAVGQANGRYCYVPTTQQFMLGEIVDLFELFKALLGTLLMLEIPDCSFAKKL